MKTLNNFINEALINKNSNIKLPKEEVLSIILKGFGINDPKEYKEIVEAIKKWIDDYKINEIYGPYISNMTKSAKENWPDAEVKPELWDYVTEDSIEYLHFNDDTWIEGGSNGIIYKGEDKVGFTIKEL